MTQPENPSEPLLDYYNRHDEENRLSGPWGQIEYIRTQGMIQRYLPPPPATILDVGGAAGRYACWLAQLGYRVHLVDPVPRHVQQAQAASASQPETPIASCTLGDACQLQFGAQTAAVVLLLGPLYHLTEVAQRHQALAEAYRVLQPGGVLFAAAISRFASTIDGLVSSYFLDPAFRTIMRTDLATGQHRNPTQKTGYFTDTFFHHPDELEAEVSGAGFKVEALLAVEGISYMMADFDERWQDPEHRRFLLDILAMTETERTLMGASPHLMCIGRVGLGG